MVGRGGRRDKKHSLARVGSSVLWFTHSTLYRHHPAFGWLSRQRTRWVLSGLCVQTTHFSPKLIFLSSPGPFHPNHTKNSTRKKNRKKKEKKREEKKASKTPKVYRMRGQIYSQSGSRVMWLDAFLQCSFLPLPLSFFEVSPRLPPLPQHSSPFVYSI